MTYFVYENTWGYEHSHKCTVHKADCHHCNNGHGRINTGNPSFGIWHGPFSTFQEAKEGAIKTGWKVNYCRACEPDW